MGDDDLVPTFTDGPSGIPSDLKYSLKNDADELPDLAVGRILGNAQANVATAVTRSSATRTAAGGHGLRQGDRGCPVPGRRQRRNQENRTFITMAETVRNGLVAHGVVGRPRLRRAPRQQPAEASRTARDLPAALKKPTFGVERHRRAGFRRWNEGRFMVVHRDHGWSDGWGTPGYGTADVQALTNGTMLPVVMSINCSSAPMTTTRPRSRASRS